MSKEERSAYFSEKRANEQRPCDGCEKVTKATGLSSLHRDARSKFCWTCRAHLARLAQPLTERDDLDDYYRLQYNIDFRGYMALFFNQGGRCAICRLPPGGKDQLFVDHCHETEKVRGLLCRTCNTGIGMLRDSVLNLSRAVIYLTDHPADNLKRSPLIPKPTPAKVKAQREARREYFERRNDPDDCFGT